MLLAISTAVSAAKRRLMFSYILSQLHAEALVVRGVKSVRTMMINFSRTETKMKVGCVVGLSNACINNLCEHEETKVYRL